MNIDILLGLQWGDEGKGKIVDALTPDYDIVARFQGGPNAGHTIEFNKTKHVLHLIPSGIFHEGKINIIGNGVVLDPVVFRREVESLGIDIETVRRRLLISLKAHLILPTHKLLDAAYENALGDSRIGSTLRGIGPAYTDKAARSGIRVGDLLLKNFREFYNEHVSEHLRILRGYGRSYDLQELENEWFEAAEFLKQFKTVNADYYIDRSLREGRCVLAEGAQGTMLDIDFGTYPYVTSSNTVAAGACTGLGIAPSRTGEVFGIFKAYCTRVGSGPFPTELNDENGQLMRDRGNEYGSTTGRPRRCGWLDLPALKYAIMINGVTRLFMMKADVLSGFREIEVCTSYTINGEEITELPYCLADIEKLNYKTLAGWNCEITECKNWSEMPEALRHYIEFIEEETGVPVTIVSVGPDRSATIYRQ
ncbi:MAG: adenylosuccinate synthase [Bacteroidales bacterium]|jgi:adenylosuccinate synthase|nr:adenylosuccinate synthase [Bacteroidales bacterium]